MRAAAPTLCCLLLAMLSQPVAAAADEPPVLAHNPFSRPSSETQNDDLGIIATDDGSDSAPALQATMVGLASGLANIGGRILKPGDEIQGYRLVAVHEDYAVFKRNGKLMTVYVKPPAAEDDE